MSRSVRIRHVPARLAAGAFILNSGLSKWRPDNATAAALHGMASQTYPILKSIPPRRFVRLVSATEVALGVAVLVPLVPTGLAGAGLAAFSTGLLGLYLRTPGMREPGSLRPTQQGITIAKDVWLLGIGLGFLIDALVEKDPDNP
jgi:hypothetical protein